MAKNAYLLISDLHDSATGKANRYDYPGEILDVKKQIIRLTKKYKEAFDRVFIIFLGDVFDRGYQDVFGGTIANNFFILLRDLCDGIYLLFGNHELTYYKGNPIYTLFSEIESEKIRNVQNKLRKPQGIFQTMRVVDLIEDGEVFIHFNHYGTDQSKPVTGKVNIALFHQDVVCPQILDAMQQGLNRTLYGSKPLDFDDAGIFENINHAFFGHMHSVYGEWDWKSEVTEWTATLHYLGSLGRPNYLEVNDSQLERDIPCILVTDGKFDSIISNKFFLRSYDECVKPDIVTENQEKYEKTKERKEQKFYEPVYDEPIKNLVSRCNTQERIQRMEELLSFGKALVEDDIRKQMNLEGLYVGY